MNITTTWTEELYEVLSMVNERLLGLAESATADGGKIHISELAEQASQLAPSVENTLLKSLISDYINNCEGFKVVRGQYGGAMRDNDTNRPKKEKNAEGVAVRKQQREAKAAAEAAEKEARKQERTRERAERLARKAQEAEQARLAAEAAAAAVEAVTEVSESNESSDVEVAV